MGTCGRPLLDGHHTIVDADGNFKKLHYYKQLFYVDPEEVYEEWKAQIEAFLASGLKPTHLDSHHHVNNLELILPIFKRLSKEYDLPVRNNFKQNEDEKFVTTDVFEYQPETLLANTENILEHFKGVNVVEVMCHPAYIDKNIIEESQFVMPRIEELAALIHPNTKKKFQDSNHFQLISFRDL